MSPAALFTVRMPPATVQLAEDLSRTDCHSSRFLPSEQHDGVGTCGASLVTPGVTTSGTGSQTSVSSGFGCCAGKDAAATSNGREREPSRMLEVHHVLSRV